MWVLRLDLNDNNRPQEADQRAKVLQASHVHASPHIAEAHSQRQRKVSSTFSGPAKACVVAIRG